MAGVFEAVCAVVLGLGGGDEAAEWVAEEATLNVEQCDATASGAIRA